MFVDVHRLATLTEIKQVMPLRLDPTTRRVNTHKHFRVLIHKIVASFRQWWSKVVSPPDQGTLDEAIAQQGARENHGRAERGLLENRKARLRRNGEKLLPKVEAVGEPPYPFQDSGLKQRRNECLRSIHGARHY